jgi:hypothetical protein
MGVNVASTDSTLRDLFYSLTIQSVEDVDSLFLSLRG